MKVTHAKFGASVRFQGKEHPSVDIRHVKCEMELLKSGFLAIYSNLERWGKETIYVPFNNIAFIGVQDEDTDSVAGKETTRRTKKTAESGESA